MTIRNFSDSDVEALCRIYNFYVRTSTVTFETEELTVTQMAARLTDPISAGYPCIVAEENGEVAGYCALHPWRPRFDHTAEATLYLAPEFCGKGLGRMMTLEILDRARQVTWLHAVIAAINADNAASIKLVENIGFKKVAHYLQVGRKFGKWLDDVEYEYLI